jgi:segregation and condensation protein B
MKTWKYFIHLAYYWDMDIERKVEALLFASEESLGILEISSILFEDQKLVKKALKNLIKDYEGRETCIEITSIGKKYRMTLKTEFLDLVTPVAKSEMTQDQIKLLTIILNSKKIMRGEINEKFRGKSESLIYSLKKSGFIKGEKYRNTEIIKLTSKFYKYFNIERGEKLTKITTAGDLEKND